MKSQSRPQSFCRRGNPFLSVGLACLIVTLWAASLVDACTVHLSDTSWLLTIVRVLVRAFLHTGLFIVTHEAIHHNISQNPWINDVFGYTTSFLYAVLPYRVLARNHRLHHQFPGTEKDPDHSISGFLLWYFQFMKSYQVGWQVWISLAGISFGFSILTALQIPFANLILFWILPMVASSLQLFTFGIFLPHRKTEEGYHDSHAAQSIGLPVVLSFITCYHFGYHWEHHQYPYLPWYRLPQAYWQARAEL